MKKIQDLHTFITNLNLFAAEQMDSYVDDLTVTPAGRQDATAGQIIVAEMDYTATFNIERYPHGQVSAELLFAQISAWLLENDTDRLDSIIFPILIDLLDAETADLEFGIPFNELIVAEETVDGPILINGVRYALL